MQHYAAFHLCLHCLQKYLFRGFPNTKGYKAYNTPHYNMYLSYCGSQMFLPWNFTKELQEIYHEVAIFL